MTQNDTELYREFIQKLTREEHRPVALNDIKNFLVFKPASESIAIIKNVGITKLVECLNLPDKNQVDLTCEVLKICFGKFNVGDIIKNYTSHIMYLLRHEKECVRSLAVDEVYKAVSADSNILPAAEFVDIFVAAGQLVGDQNLGISNKAILITSNLPIEAYNRVLDEMKVVLEYSKSSKCNAYEVIINISSKSTELLKIAADLNYISSMLADLDSEDVLYQLNILELLSRLAVTRHGISYLVKQGTLDKVAALVSELPNNPLGDLLRPGCMKFFGNIGHNYPKEVLEKYPIFIDMLLESFEVLDPTSLHVALDTLGFIGSTIEGKLCLAALGCKYTQTVGKVGELIKNSPTDIKISALNCFASLIGVYTDPNASKTGPIDHRVTLMTREWFRSLSSNPAASEVLFQLCKNPFPEVKLAAFKLLDAVCQHQWGEEIVARTAGYIEFLLDRTVHYSKEAKELKYDIIKRLSNSHSFDENIIERLQAYVAQGPFFSKSQMEVAMEEGD